MPKSGKDKRESDGEGEWGKEEWEKRVKHAIDSVKVDEKDDIKIIKKMAMKMKKMSMKSRILNSITFVSL